MFDNIEEVGRKLGLIAITNKTKYMKTKATRRRMLATVLKIKNNNVGSRYFTYLGLNWIVEG